MASSRWLIVLILFSSLVAAQRTPKTQHYKFVDIRYPGAVSTTLQGINDNGDMVGTFLDSSNFWHGFVVKNGKITVLDHPGNSTYPRGINTAGQIAGYFGTPFGTAGIAGTSGFTWSSATGFTLLQYTGSSTDANPSGPFEILAEGLNDTGLVVGSIFDGVAFNNHSKIWQGATVKDFCWDAWTFGGYVHGVVAKGVSNSGLVVGYGVDSSQSTDDALIEAPDGTCTKFDTGLNAQFVRMTAISSDGARMAGFYRQLTPNGTTSASGFIWSGGTATTINFPKADDTLINGVNTSGVLVGTATMNGKTIGFVAIPKGPTAK